MEKSDPFRKLLGAWRAGRPKPTPSRHFLDAYVRYGDRRPIVREAYALHAFWTGVETDIQPGETIVGMMVSDEPAGFHYGRGTWIDAEAAERLAAHHAYDAEAREELARALRFVGQRQYNYADPSVYTREELDSIAAVGSTTTWFGGHMVLDYARLLSGGFRVYANDISRRRSALGQYGENDPNAPDGGQADFYEAMAVTLDGVMGFIRRLSGKALTLGMAQTARALQNLLEGPPQTFREALQLIWIMHLLDGADSFGRFDRHLHPFYERGLAMGLLDRQAAKDLIFECWLKIEEAGSIQNMTIGGTGWSGEAGFSEVTLLCLEAVRELRFKGPNLCLRLTDPPPAPVWRAALDCIASGTGLPALYNDAACTDSLAAAGAPLEEAADYSLAGCSQISLPGMSNFANDIGLLNVAKIFELTLFDGRDPRTGKVIGPSTGAAGDFSDFAALRGAFYRQLEHACALQVSIHNKEVPHRGSREGYALRSLFTRDCLDRALGVFEGGARRNHVQLELIGITNAADSLYAVQAAVFGERRVGMAELLDALRANWVGHEALRLYMRSLPKFGNDQGGVDALRVEMTRFLYDWFNRAPAPLGGIYVPGEVIFVTHEWCGAAVGATPDGRAAGEVLADSAGAASGCGREGPTALMNSVLALPARDYLLTSVVLNMRFLPDAFASADARQAVSGMLLGFFRQGGTQLQINVCDEAALREAMRNPEAHRDLVVRVGGYSEYFVRLSPTLQREIVARAAYAIA